MRIDTRSHPFRCKRLAAGECDSRDTGTGRVDTCHFCIGSDFDPRRFRRARHRVRQCTHAAFNVTPHASRAAGGTHDVVQQDIRSARCGHGLEVADDRVGAQGGLELIRFEPAIQNRHRVAG